MNGGEIKDEEILRNEISELYRFADNAKIPIFYCTNRGTFDDPDITSIFDLIMEEMEIGSFDPSNFFHEYHERFDFLKYGDREMSMDDVTLFLMCVCMVLENRGMSWDNITDMVNRYVGILKNGSNLDYKTSDLQATYDNFLVQFDNEAEKDSLTSKKIEDIQSVLRFYLPHTNRVYLTEPTITATIYSYNPKFNGKLPSKDDGLDIFNEIITSKYVPYAKFIDSDGRTYHKIYEGVHKEDRPNYNSTVLNDNDYKSKDNIYLTLWLGKGKDISISPVKDFFVATYNLINNYLIIESVAGKDEDDEENLAYSEVARTRVSQCLPALDLGIGNEEKVKGEMQLYGQKIDDISFIDMLLNDDVMNSLIYNDDYTTPYPEKKRFIINGKPLFYDYKESLGIAVNPNYISNYANITLTLKKEETKEQSTVVLNGQEVPVPANTQFYKISIGQASSKKVIERFNILFRALLLYYHTNAQKIIEEFAIAVEGVSLLPALQNNSAVPEETPQEKNTGRQGGVKLNALKKKAPELFNVPGYSRTCQAPVQPYIIDDQVKTWSEQEYRQRHDMREFIKFPKSGPNPHYFSCDPGQVPGLRETVGMQEASDEFKAKYKYLPCCAELKTKPIPTNYRNYMNYLVEPEGSQVVVEGRSQKTAKAENMISTLKILSSGGLGKLTISIEKALRGYSDEESNLARMGVPLDNNSLLHCVLFAISDSTYMSLTTEKDRKDYVSRYRQAIAENINIDLLKQEMFDYTSEEIKESLLDNNIFLDAAKFYRALEEIFQINIFVFVAKTADGKEAGDIEIPRFKLFHSRSLYPDRKTVVVAKLHSGSDFAQYELIVDERNKNDLVKIFTEETTMLSICYENLQNSLRTLTWTIENNNFTINENLYSFVNYQSLFQNYLVGQAIDENGKLRYLTLNIEGSPLTITTIPSQPLNLPIIKQIYNAAPASIVKLLGQPGSFSYQGDDLEVVTGFWYKIINLEEGLYAPIIPTKRREIAVIPLSGEPGSKNPIESYPIQITKRINKLKSTLNIIVQLVRWVFSIELSNYNDASVDKFVEEYFSVANPEFTGDSSNFYKLQHVTRTLPKSQGTTTARRAMEQIERVREQNLVVEGRFVMYNSNFSQKIKEMLKNYYRLIADTEIKPIQFIPNFYQSESDFKEVPGSKIFISNDDFSSWLKTVDANINFVNYFTIHNIVGGTITKSPYMYRDKDTGKIYILQTVPTKEEALALAFEWNHNKVNLVRTDKRINGDISHVIFGIDAAGDAVPIDDKRIPGIYYLSILRHGNSYKHDGDYAAMLEIL